MRQRSAFPRRAPRAVTFALPALLLALAACGGDQPPPARPPVPVTVAEARLESAPIELAATGTVEARATVEVRSRVGGEVVRVHFREGDEVERGQLLFTVDPRLGAATNTTALNFEPIAALALGWVVLGQELAARQMVGALLVVAAVVLIGSKRH